MPAERRKKSTPEGVPNVGDPDRKRVLNVLAQRRYRQRRREKIAELEAKVITPPEDEAQSHTIPRLDDCCAQNAFQPSTDEDLLQVHVDEIIRNTGMNIPEADPPQGFDVSCFFGPLEPQSLLPSLIPSSSSSSASSNSNSSPPPLNFPITPDAAELSVPIMATLRAAVTIATNLGVETNIYNPSYLHTLSATSNPLLPPNLHPTPAQMAIPHHPLLDVLPWPSVREKLICMLAMPSALRPLIAQEDDGAQGQTKAVFQLIHDVDDLTHGCRVHANLVGWGQGNEMSEEAWEVGESFWKNWWWCIDGRVLAMTNLKRRERGVAPLRITN